MPLHCDQFSKSAPSPSNSVIFRSESSNKMVALIAAVNSPSATRKNRRRQSKKPAQTPSAVDFVEAIDVDEEMDPAEPPEDASESQLPTNFPDGGDDDDLMIDTDDVPLSSAPAFPPITCFCPAHNSQIGNETCGDPPASYDPAEERLDHYLWSTDRDSGTSSQDECAAEVCRNPGIYQSTFDLVIYLNEIAIRHPNIRKKFHLFKKAQTL